MILTKLIKILDKDFQCPNADFKVKGISCNSKNVKDGFLFVAIKGTSKDGNVFINEAIKNGARVIVTEDLTPGEDIANNVIFVKVKSARHALAELAAEFYGRPADKIKILGITGTNGKTTVSYLIEAILKEAGKNPAVLGTINYRFNNKLLPAKNTTPGALELQSIFSEMLKGGIDYVAMEVSSHALAQDRVRAINFHSAIFTNITQDHLDYHHTIDEYFLAKAKLFAGLNRRSFAVINNDDAYSNKIKTLTAAKVVTYGIKNASCFTAEELNFGAAHTEFSLRYNQKQLKIKSRLIGAHNVYNLLSAIAWSLTEGLDLPLVKSALEKLDFVPGRLERIDFKGDFSVFVDYAHTEDALKNVLTSLRRLTSKRIIVVFGCGGERDKTKRPKMGEAVSRLADYAIITNDNPRSEDPLAIIEEIKKGMQNDHYCVALERMSAIEKSLSLAKSGDIVLVAGKGHENYQILKDRVLEFDDRKAIKECLKSGKY